VTLSPLPCWDHLSPEEQKKKVAELIREIEEEAAAQREATGKPVLGSAAVLKQHQHERPNRPKEVVRSARPRRIAEGPSRSL